jgi:hypothetical protein
VVIYHGREPWNIPLDFQSLFLWTEGLERYLPQFEYLLFDLPRMKDEEIDGKFLLKTSLILLKYILQTESGGEPGEDRGMSEGERGG